MALKKGSVTVGRKERQNAKGEVKVISPGVQVTVVQMPFTEGFDVLALLSQATPEKAPNLTGTVDSMGTAIVWSAVRGIIGDAGRLRKICELFGAYSAVKVNGGEDGLTLDKQHEVFGVDYGMIAEWLWFCISHNFGTLADMIPDAGKDAISAAIGQPTEQKARP